MGMHSLFLDQIEQIRMLIGAPKDGAHFLFWHEDHAKPNYVSNTLGAKGV
jgi:hypothetical protein